MLTRDIKLEHAVIDLVDNCIDGAKNTRGQGHFEGLKVDIKLNKDEFTIVDNCGGFSLHTAKNDAFMFGRPPKATNNVGGSVGRFGVGMKRALFKMGNVFEVESKHKEDHFQVDVNVEEWSSKPSEWTFEYSTIDNGASKSNIDEEGTYINVKELSADVSHEFNSAAFQNGLKSELERTLNFYLNRGIKITLNKANLVPTSATFLVSELLQPYYEEFAFNGVKVKIYCGIGLASPDLAGWYIYCNERLVVEKDKTNLTGWEGIRIGDGVQKFHHIYAMFRGMVLFSADDSKLLPMTTTKTGVDSNSAIYRAARGRMINAMQQVMGFLKSFNSDEERLEVITASEEINFLKISQKTFAKRFVHPEIAQLSSSGDNKASIAFKTEKETVEKLKTYFKVSTNKECGEKLLDFFVHMEGDKL